MQAPRRIALVSVSLAACCIAAPAAAVVVEGNIETSIRPVVSIVYPDAGGAAAQRTAIGIFDTGDPLDTLSRETAALLGINLAGPPLRGATAAQPVTSGGWLGGTFDPPERNTAAAVANLQVRAGDPAHVFTGADTARTATVTSNGIRLIAEDYNGRFSENHTSMVFATRAAPADNLAVLIDPINATALPFAYDNTNAGNGRGLLTPTLANGSLPLDQRGSSVSYLAAGDPRVPEPGRNDNPGFVHFIPLTAREFGSTTLTPAPGNATVNAGLADPRQLTLTLTAPLPAGVTINGLQASDFGGLLPGYRPVASDGSLPGANFLMEVQNANLAIGGQVNPSGFERRDGTVRVVVRDNGGNVVRNEVIALPSQAPLPFGSIVIPELGINTGAAALIDTGAPRTVAGTIVGTDVLNRFGQVFDFANQRLTLVGPTDPRVRELRGDGILFTVDPNTVGLARTGVNQEATFGAIPQLQGNAQANTGAATIAGTNTPEAAGTVFRTHLTASNATYIDEAALGLPRVDAVINAMSLGADSIGPGAKLFFSVDAGSQGLAGTAVRAQHDLNQHRADVFETPSRQASPGRDVAGRNHLLFNQEVMGLGSNVGPSARAAASPDDLISLDLLTQLALPDNALSNLDSPIVRQDDAGTAARPRIGDERLGKNFDLYFSLLGSQDIFRSDAGTIFARGFEDIGLSAGGPGGMDDIDALALFRPSVGPGRRGHDVLDIGLALSPDLVVNPANGNMTFDPNADGLFLGIDMFHSDFLTDLALFSLAPGSSTLALLGQFGLSAADIFITDFDGTFTLFASAQSLGLRPEDNIDALDSLATPAPGTAGLLLAGLVMLSVRLTRGLELLSARMPG